MIFEILNKNKKKKYNILLWGSSPLEYALAIEFKKSKFLNNLYVANANEAMKKIGINIDYNGQELVEIAKEKKIDIFICNNDDTLLGIIDTFKMNGIKCIGANRKWSLLEASKHIGKKFVEKYNICHPKYDVVKNINDFENKIKNFEYPVVIKADGYSRGCGVFICNNYDEAYSKTKIILNKEIITTTSKVIIEEYKKGQEISFMQIWDGKHLKSFCPIKDFKRLEENNEGPNTAGMASYCPFNLTKKQYKSLSRYSKQLEKALRTEKVDFSGIIYSGIMFTNENLYVLEYNVRFGFPETIALINHLDCDLLEILISATQQKIQNLKLKYKKGISFALNFACKDYPDGYLKKEEISTSKLNEITSSGASIYYGDGKFINQNFVKNGNIAFTVSYNSKNPFKYLYNILNRIGISEFKYRKDISKDS